MAKKIRRGRPRTRKAAKRNEQIIKFRDRGWTFQRIADRYGITAARVHQIVNDPLATVVTEPPAKRGRPKGSKNKAAA